MSKKYTKRWFKATVIRMYNIFAQCLGAMFIINIFFDVSLVYLLYSSFLASAISFLVSLAGLPESRTDGALLIDTHDPNKDVFRLSLDTDLSELPNKKQIVLVVDAKADLSQEKPVL